ncbi:MAG: hypothetical protein A2W93_10130 [Bacteroidetes bacterium GWF2_43_63]|nr:MAG: hypothetical protein A2W94_02340 [Bacteroidetes bacterium GWE2_42_42]OFY52881.1 MAG: hypothetical protein A2W93_10130 [Bacteroidetes bacterium GWF2_43_63]HBG70086.1 DUF2892 domain-containing protein [Bacteroidales bacterium]HCB62307.1 DUF2892 domain-containing protein [Bacteroidales bacterium]
MKKNIGQTDTIIRIIIGLGIGAAGWYYESWLGLIGLVPLLTAFTGFCGIYALLGISTCPRKKAEK